MDYNEYGAFESLVRAYLNADDDAKAKAKELMTDEEYRTLQIASGCYKLFTDDNYHRIIRETMGEVIYEHYRQDDRINRTV